MGNDLQLERRIRYRLKKHGMKLHKTPRNEYGDVWYQVLDTNEDPKDHADDEYGWYKLDKLWEYCGELEQEERAD